MNVGDHVEVAIERPAHGGIGVGVTGADSRVILVASAFPGDRVMARVTHTKRSFVRAEIVQVLAAGKYRGEQRCTAADQSGGCCDFGVVHPEYELELKTAVLQDQLRRIAGITTLPEIEQEDLQPTAGWRVRWRLGVDAEGRAGVRRRGGNEVVWQHHCVQAPEGLLDGIVGEQAARFTPGAELIVALGSDGNRTVCETNSAARGRRVERAQRHIEGPEYVVQDVGRLRYELPPPVFWQSHRGAPESYTRRARVWLSDVLQGHHGSGIGWDLYGGVGLFVPSILDALSTTNAASIAVHSVETSPLAASVGSAALQGLPVRFHRRGVEKQISQLPAPDAVVLDPPRKGAGGETITAIAQARPRVALHIGCDPATFARDCGAWKENGYELTRLAVVNAFPGTHHSETFGLFEPARLGSRG